MNAHKLIFTFFRNVRQNGKSLFFRRKHYPVIAGHSNKNKNLFYSSNVFKMQTYSSTAFLINTYSKDYHNFFFINSIKAHQNINKLYLNFMPFLFECIFVICKNHSN